MARILIVDDDIDIRGLLFRILSDAGHEVELATGVAHALEIWAQHDWTRRTAPFDLAITDLHMPSEKEGIELARQIRAYVPDLPIILITGDEHPPAEWGDGQWVRKPLDNDAVLAEVEIALCNSGKLPPAPAPPTPPGTPAVAPA